MENPGAQPAAAPAPLTILKKRSEFLAAQSGDRAGFGAFLLVRSRKTNAEGVARIGFTVTRKIGKAVLRNRIRRRFKEVARQVFAKGAEPGFDYVVIARPGAETRAFALLLDDMKRALLRLAALPK